MKPRRIGLPQPASVSTDPLAVGGVPVAAVLEEWVVEDRWWTARPLRRRYLELVLENGRNVVVYRDLVTREWFEQRS